MDTNLKAVGNAMINALMESNVDLCGIDGSCVECTVDDDKVTFEMNRLLENPANVGVRRRLGRGDWKPPIGTITYTVTVTAKYEAFDPEA